MTLFTEHVASVSFDLSLTDPCASTELLEFRIPDITIALQDAPIVELVPEVKDSASQVGGNADGLSFCGARAYELVDPLAHANYLTFATDSMTVASGSDTEIGIHAVQVKVWLVDYPEISKTTDFDVIINPIEPVDDPEDKPGAI